MYLGSSKIVKPSRAAAAHLEAKTQNERAKAAIEAAGKRFSTTTNEGDVVWAEVKKITAVDGTTDVDLTGRVTIEPTAKLETIGATGAKHFDTTMPTGDASTLDKVVEAIWRLAEMGKR